MVEFKFAPEIKVGDVFTRIDKNGRVWEAKVINRTEYFVDVEKITPYKIKVANDDMTACLGCWHWEDPKPTHERAEIHEEWIEIETGEFKETIWGKSPVRKKVKTFNYHIYLKENYSKYPYFDKPYTISKSTKSESTKEIIKNFYKLSEEK